MSVLPGLTGNNRRIVFIALIVVGALFILDPFHWFGQKAVPPKKMFSSGQVQDISAILKDEGKTARDVLSSTFAKKRLLMVGTQNFIKEELDFVGQALPWLPDMGVNVLGLEYLRAADQADIDAFMAAPQFDSARAENLVFRRLPLWGYREYVDLLRAAWDLNKARAQGFKVIGLALTQDFSAIQKNADFRDPEIMKSILSQGRPDSFLAETILTYLSGSKNQKMLVVCERVSSIYQWTDEEYTKKMADFGFANEKRAAVILHEKLGTELATLITHGPFPYAKSPVQAAFPLDGLIDAALESGERSPLTTVPAVYLLQGTRLGALDSGTNDYSVNSSEKIKKTVLLSDLADLYVIFGTIHTLHAVQVIPNFVTSANLPDALKMLPTVRDVESMNATILNDEIKEQAKDFQTALSDFH